VDQCWVDVRGGGDGADGGGAVAVSGEEPPGGVKDLAPGGLVAGPPAGTPAWRSPYDVHAVYT